VSVRKARFGIGTAELPTTAEARFVVRRRFMLALVNRSRAPEAPVEDRAGALEAWGVAHRLYDRHDWVADWLAQVVADWRKDELRRTSAWVGPEPLSATWQDQQAGPAPTVRLEITPGALRSMPRSPRLDVPPNEARARKAVDDDIDERFSWAVSRYLGVSTREIANGIADEGGEDRDPRALRDQVRQTSDAILSAIGLVAPRPRRGRPPKTSSPH
jgi:hypothetical protein